MTGLGIAMTGAVGSATGHALAMNATAPDEADVGQLGRQGSVFGLQAFQELGITLGRVHGRLLTRSSY
jgi:hypothetical protein